jgi:hypothetical protein
MKKSIQQIWPRTIAASLGIGLAVLFGQSALAQNSSSFDVTNNLSSGINYVANYPTNANFIGTGTPVDLRSYNTSGFYFYGAVSNNAAAIVGVDLVRSGITKGAVTNQFVGGYVFEVTPPAVWHISIPIPATTNANFVWYTNLSNDFCGPAVRVGVFNLTNSLAAGQVITNLDVGVVKKIMPLAYP